MKLGELVYWISFVLIVLKLVNIIHISWLLVISPIIVYCILFVLFLIVGAIAFHDTYN